MWTGELGNLNREYLNTSYQGVAMTLIDSLSSLAVLGNRSEFAKNVNWLARHVRRRFTAFLTFIPVALIPSVHFHFILVAVMLSIHFHLHSCCCNAFSPLPPHSCHCYVFNTHLAVHPCCCSAFKTLLTFIPAALMCSNAHLTAILAAVLLSRHCSASFLLLLCFEPKP